MKTKSFFGENLLTLKFGYDILFTTVLGEVSRHAILFSQTGGSFEGLVEYGKFHGKNTTKSM